ncbi:MAG: hypothetical protein JW789_01650 [Candidatus Aenigmarchaeota archaeon]|nr:hypothetical protein [Candidatus Aenigmarchaeota archaeon]
MDEIREVEMELRRLREDATKYKKESESAHKETKTLESKNDYLVNKLKEASYVYGEAGKRLLYFINNQVNPVTKRLSDLEADDKKLAAKDKALNDSMISMEKLVKSDFTKLDKRLAVLDLEIRTTQEKVQAALKSAVRRAEKGDILLEEKIGATVADIDSALNVFKSGVDKRLAAKLLSTEGKINKKLEMLNERSLLIGKDIEALRKFEGDIQGLDGKLQITIANLTQTRLDTEKLSQKLRAEMKSTKTLIEKDMTSLRGDVEKSVMTATAELRQADQKNLGDIKLEAERTQQALSSMVETLKADMASFENDVSTSMRKSQAALTKDLKLYGSGVDKRMLSIETNLGAAKKSQTDAERIFSQRMDKMMQHAAVVDERLDGINEDVLEHMRIIREGIARKEIHMKNELQKMNKVIGANLKASATAIDKRISLMAKDVQHLMEAEAQLIALAGEVGKRKEDITALSSRMNALIADSKDKSEKNDMMLKKQIEFIRNDIENRLESAESRIAKENVTSFSTARHELKKDVHALREENATLRADVKNLKSMGVVLNDLQQGVMGMEKRITDSINEMKHVSSSVKSDIELQSLQASKDFQGMSAKVKADLDAVISRERERFASQTAELDTRLKELLKVTGELSGISSSNAQSSSSNAKKIALLEKKIERVLGEVVGMKKEYRLEMGKLIKELEG